MAAALGGFDIGPESEAGDRRYFRLLSLRALTRMPSCSPHARESAWRKRLARPGDKGDMEDDDVRRESEKSGRGRREDSSRGLTE